MQNPMRFIDLGLGFSPVEISLIKLIKNFPLFESHIFESRQQHSNCLFQCCVMSPSQASKIALTLGSGCKRQTLLLSRYAISSRRNTTKSFHCGIFPLLWGVWWDEKFDELCTSWDSHNQLFQKSAWTTERVLIKSKVFFAAPDFYCIFGGEWD